MSKNVCAMLHNPTEIMTVVKYIRNNHRTESVNLMSSKLNISKNIIVGFIDRMRLKIIQDLSEFRKGVDYDFIQNKNFHVPSCRNKIGNMIKTKNAFDRKELEKPILSACDKAMSLEYAKILGYVDVETAKRVLTPFVFNMKYRSFKVSRMKKSKTKVLYS